MQSRKLYYEDVYLKEFTAKVISCEEYKCRWNIVLDQTAFYPEGGGQPADQGMLILMSDEAAEAAQEGTQPLSRALCASCYSKVEDVHEREGLIVHTCDRPLEAGQAVCGVLDWDRRFDHMQQHSGEHVVSGLICSHFHANNVGFHMGSDMVTIDFDAALTWEDALRIEAEANAYIMADHPLEILWPDAEELENMEYRSKKALSGDVRIVKFDGADICACCGTHVASSAQIGLVKLISCQKHKSGTRIEMLAGRRAFEYLSHIWSENAGISRMLSAKPLETASAVERLKDEQMRLQERISGLLSREFDRLAGQYRDCGDTLIVYDELSPDDTRRLCDRVAGVCGGLCAVFAGGEGHYNYAIISAGGPQDDACTAKANDDRVKALVARLNRDLNGRGGGRGGWAQGSVDADRSAISAFFDSYEE